MANELGLAFAGLLDVAKGATVRDLKVARPAEVMRYDAAKQLVDVRPLLADWFPGEDAVEQVFPPIITNVPVMHPGAGGGVVLFPVAVGDTVQLLISDRSLDAWLDQGGTQAPADLRRHHMTDAVALLGLHDNKHAWPNAPTDHVEIGMATGPRVALKNSTIELGGNSDAMALASKVKAELDAFIATYNLHTHVVTTVGSSTTQTGTSLTTAATQGLSGSTASSTVKAI